MNSTTDANLIVADGYKHKVLLGRRKRHVVFVLSVVFAACGRSSLEPLAGEDGTTGGLDGKRGTSTSTPSGGGSLAGTALANGGTSGASGGTGGNDSGGTGPRGSDGDTGAGGEADPFGCVYGGTRHALGSTYTARDGCNDCVCTAAGSDCTSFTCDVTTCDKVSNSWAAAVDRAVDCHPQGSCDEVFDSLGCGCQFYANDTTELEALRSSWKAAGCDALEPIMCHGCSPRPAYAYCGSDGLCHGSDRPPGGAGGAAGDAGGDSAGDAGLGGVGARTL